MLTILRNIFYSFPLQLLFLLLKKHLLIVLFWIFLFGYVGDFVGGHYGIPLLFLDPEYLGEVNFISFMIIGFALGGFIMAWNVSFYIINSHRFHFLASLTRPFTKFCLNNAVVPVAFTGYYIYRIIVFQSEQTLQLDREIIGNILGLISGIMLMVTITIMYFMLFNKNVDRFLESLKDKARERLLNNRILLDRLDDDSEDEHQWPVETYFSNPFRVRLVRNVAHYDPKLIDRVLNQHNKNGFLIITTSFLVLIGLGVLVDNPLFRIPAAASIILFFTILMALASALGFWFRGWRLLVLVVIILGFNYLSKYDLILYKNKVFGLDYEKPPKAYNNVAIDSMSTDLVILDDIEHTTNILKRWQRRMQRIYGERKPVMILLSTSGGGARAGYWTMHVLQELEKQFGGRIMDHTVLMTGASGGMLGAAYFRELYHRVEKGESVDYLDPIYREDMGKDLLNSITFTLTVNDLFYPWQRYYYNGKKYRKDRGYIFERQFNENTAFLLDKKLTDYRKAEESGAIPLLILSPTIIKDQRVLYISPQPVSYLTRPYVERKRGHLDYLAADGVEFMRYFAEHDAEELKFVSALRMNASFPYLLPGVYLPSDPQIKVLDAGIRDNYGISTGVRFMNVFREWIEKNTGGVIFLQLRTDRKLVDFEEVEGTSFINELLNPVSNIYNNFMYEQEYTNDHLLGLGINSIDADVSIINFEYMPASLEKEASMSLHLTDKEKMDIREAYFLPHNQIALQRLEELMGSKRR